MKTFHPGVTRPHMYVRKTHWRQCSESVRSRQQTGGRATSQEADAVVQMQGDSGCDISLDSHYLQDRSRHLSATLRSSPSSGGSSLVLLWGTPLHHLA